MSSWGVSFGSCSSGGETTYVVVDEVDISIEDNIIEVEVAESTIECNISASNITVDVESVSLTTEIFYGS